ENLRARYSADGPKVLHNISFEIKSGDLVGITRSGKSSQALSLSHCIPTEGHVNLDGLVIVPSSLMPRGQGLQSSSRFLRCSAGRFEKIFSLSRSSRMSHDATLKNAPCSAGLFNLQEKGKEYSKITLDSAIYGGGRNLSVGQHQILRAIL
ncbi:hypothetical protein BU17DRAFT_52922, partial [Hysterangium stoloniferum]